MTADKSDTESANRLRIRSPLERGVAPQQWLLPVGFPVNGDGFAMLTDVLKSDTATKPLDALTDDELAHLTAERIRGQRHFEISIVGKGIVDKERAISEVGARTKIGLSLIEIEKGTIRRVIDAARAAASAAGAALEDGNGR